MRKAFLGCLAVSLLTLAPIAIHTVELDPKAVLEPLR